jgi:RecA-family ATPase
VTDERKVVTFTRLDQIQRKPLDPVIDGILYANTLASVVGKSGSCKSFLAQGMCAAIATGTTWMGRRVKQGAVFYIGGEGLAGIRKRFDGWSNYTRLALVDAPLYVASGMPALCDELTAAAVVEEISTIADTLFFNAGGTEPVLVVIDTLARAMAGGDENSASDVGRLIRGLDWIRERWECCVLVIHHTGHSDGASQRGRGSSAYHAALDSELLVTSDGARVTVRSVKQKDWPAMPELYLDRHVVDVDVEGTAETTLVLDEAQGPNLQQRAVETRQDVQRLKAAGVSIRGIASELGITKSKVEHELAMLARDTEQYRDASNGL